MNDRLPPWLRISKRDLVRIHHLKKQLRERSLHTVCEAARCPNMAECFARPTATFLLMGDICTRGCRFCNILPGTPLPLNPNEPYEVAKSAAEMKLSHVVITSVTRDDLPLGGAEHFTATASAVREMIPNATIEVLTPDFLGSHEALNIIADSPINVFNHNMETVERLYPAVRPSADYRRSLDVLAYMRSKRSDVLCKSGFMLGLGETDDEVKMLLGDLRTAGVHALTIGQYLRPRLARLPVVAYITPDIFATWGDIAKKMGFTKVASAPLVRSSYMADRMIEKKIKLLVVNDASR